MIKLTKSLLKVLNLVFKPSLTTSAPYAKLPRPLNIAHRGLAGLFP